ncbi:MAG: elongation factor P [Tagaea sp. CACIAM 22H2]|jgi:elongation factor P|nr:elongation factor P [Tagaea sp. CACIAM 22H2]
MKIIGSAIRQGNVIEVDGRIWRVIKHNIVSPGKGGAFNQIEIRDIKTGTKSNMKFRSDETCELLRVEEKVMQFLFRDGDQFTLMDKESYDQMIVGGDLFGEQADFLTDNMDVSVEFVDGSPVGVELPTTTICTIVEADAVVKGQTAASSYKPAILDNGVKIGVPPFIANGERVVVNIKERAYVERAKD